MSEWTKLGTLQVGPEILEVKVDEDIDRWLNQGLIPFSTLFEMIRDAYLHQKDGEANLTNPQWKPESYIKANLCDFPKQLTFSFYKDWQVFVYAVR